jgi:hypothetical protein
MWKHLKVIHKVNKIKEQKQKLGAEPWQTLNSNNKLNVALGFTHLQYNAQHEKVFRFFYYTCTMINFVSIFLT